jgi:hypothetical protein
MTPKGPFGSTRLITLRQLDRRGFFFCFLKSSPPHGPGAPSPTLSPVILPYHLVLQFKGPQVSNHLVETNLYQHCIAMHESLSISCMQMWIETFVVLSEFSQLSKLFIANVPVNWDALGILQLLDATPALELFHVHVLVCCFLTTQLTENVCASILTNNCFFSET